MAWRRLDIRHLGRIARACPVANHAWRSILERLSLQTLTGYRIYRLGAVLMTFICVVIGWVFFRAADEVTALAILGSMLGFNGLDMQHVFANELVHRDNALKWIVAAALITWLAPNTQQLFVRYAPSLETVHGAGRLKWAPTAPWVFLFSVLALVGIYHLKRVSEFLYFQF